MKLASFAANCVQSFVTWNASGKYVPIPSVEKEKVIGKINLESNASNWYVQGAFDKVSKEIV